MDPIEWVMSPKGLNRGNTLYPRQATLLKLIFLRDDLFTEYDLEVLGKWAEGFRLVEPGEVPTPNNEDELLRFESSGALCRGLTPDWEVRLQMCKAEGRKWFREVIPIIGRRGSKGYTGALAGSYVIYDYHGLADPQGYYGVDRDKKLQAIVFAGKKEQAKTNQWRDLVNVLMGSPYFRPWIENSLGESLTIRTAYDDRRIRELVEAGVQTSMDMATFDIVPRESTLMAGRGPTSFLQYYDEMAHVLATGANRSAEEVYQCLDPQTRVLTADLEWKPLHSLVVGDRLVSMDEDPDGGPGVPRKLREAEVVGVTPSRSSAYQIVFSDETSVICSGNHRWLRSRGEGNFVWATIDIPEVRNSNSWASIRVGDRIRHVSRVWDRVETHDAGYLAGMLDGEGHVSFAERGSCRIGFTQKPGVVLERVASILDDLGFTYTRSALKSSGCVVLTVSGVDQCFRLVDQVGAMRLKSKLQEMWQGRTPGRRVQAREIVSITPLGERDLLDIETTTRTFVAEGLVSHNSATPSLDQFGVNGFIYTGSSPWQMSGQMYENYLQALSVDPATRLPLRPEMLMVQLFSWDLYTDWDIAHKLEVVPKGLISEHKSRVYQEIEPHSEWVQDPHRPLFFSMYVKTDQCGEGEYEKRIRVINPNSSWDAWIKQYGDKRLEEFIARAGENQIPDLGEPTLFNPIQVPMSAYDRQMQRLERANPDTFRVERLSQWASALNAYLDLRKIEAMFGPWNGQVLEMKHQGVLGTNYVAHGDPSKSGANFGFAIAHLEGPDHNGFMHVVFDHLGAWQPQDYEDGNIDYIMVEAEIISLARRFMPSDLTFDQFNSAGMIQRIQVALNQMNLPKRTLVYERTATAPVNWRMAETFKTALNMGLVHAPYFELAELELRFLQLTTNQKVDHPTSGPVQTKDVADAMFNVVYHLIGEQMGAFLKADLAASLPVGSHAGGFPMPANSPLGGASKDDILSRLSSGSGPLDLSRIPRRRR